MATAAQKQAELQSLRAERAQVEAELAKLRGQKAPQASVRTISNGVPAGSIPIVPRSKVSPLLLVAAAAGLGWWFWTRRKR